QRTDVSPVLFVDQDVVRTDQIARLEAAIAEFLDQGKVCAFEDHDHATQFVNHQDVAILVEGDAGDDAEAARSAAALAEDSLFSICGNEKHLGLGRDGEQEAAIAVYG